MLEKISNWYKERKSAKGIMTLVTTATLGITAEQALEKFLQNQVIYAEEIQNYSDKAPTIEGSIRNLIDQIKNRGRYFYSDSEVEGLLGERKVYIAHGYNSPLQSFVTFRYILDRDYETLATTIQNTVYGKVVITEGVAEIKRIGEDIISGIKRGRIDGEPEHLASRFDFDKKYRGATIYRYGDDAEFKRKIDNLYHTVILSTDLQTRDPSRDKGSRIRRFSPALEEKLRKWFEEPEQGTIQGVPPN